VGIDDTDSPAGGCTTHFALEAAAAFARDHGLVLRQLPRLVRLNPNIAWKTRGNAAVCLALGADRGQGQPVGASPGGTALRMDAGAAPVDPRPGHEETLRALVEVHCDLGAPGTDPAAVLLPRPPPEALYDAAVRGIVEPAAAHRALEAIEGARCFALGDGRGVVGAAAAVAFPARGPTFELIAYRDRSRWGTRRAVDYASVEAMDRRYGETFNNVDRNERHAAVAPATPCPVLIGVRGTSPDRLERAAREVEAGEPWAGFLLFETNQGTDDHVVDARLSAAAPRTTVRAMGTVADRPRRVEGGHVIFPVADEDRQLDCAAYEPTKSFRAVVAALAPGDRVRVVGAVRADGRTINLEKIEVVDVVSRRGEAPAAPAPGWYEVPVSARRHLARPLDPRGGRTAR
jgi:tRNA(Ile2)-agmatinylcytidine synthase